MLLCLDKREDEFRGVVVGEWTFVDGFQRLSTPRSIGASIAVSHSGLKRPFRRDACIAGSLLSSCRFATFSCRGTPSGRFLEQWGAIVSVGIVSCLVQTHLVSSRKGRARTSPFLACARRFRERRHARLDVGLHPRVILPRPRDEPPHIDPAVLDGVLSAHSSRPSCRQTDQAKALQNKTLMRVLRRADVADAFRHRHVSAPRPILIGSRRTSGFAFLDGHRLASALTNRRRPLPFTFTKHNPGCGRNQNKKDKPIGSIWTGASCWEPDGVPGRDLRCGLLCSMGCLPWRGVVFCRSLHVRVLLKIRPSQWPHDSSFSISFLFCSLLMQSPFTIQVLQNEASSSVVPMGFLKGIVTSTSPPIRNREFAYCLHCRKRRSISSFYDHKRRLGFELLEQAQASYIAQVDKYRGDIETEVELRHDTGRLFSAPVELRVEQPF